MLLFSKKKIFFVHIPKNAGNSIRPLCRKEGIKVITHNIRRRNKRLLAAHRGKQKIHAFCISRNPYDRLVSDYYLKEKTTHKKDLADREKFIAQYKDFDDFVKNGLEKASNEQLHFLPQVFWVLNEKGNPQVETVLRMENLQDDFNEFCRMMNLGNYDLQTTNKSKHKHWQEYYTNETKKIVQEIYKEDFNFFNYEK